MLNLEDYRRGWEWKKYWYTKNGFIREKPYSLQKKVLMELWIPHYFGKLH